MIEDQRVSDEEEEEEGEKTADEGEDLGDLGRSLSPPPSAVARAPPPLPSRGSNGRVANLAKAFEEDVKERERERSGSIGSSNAGMSVKSPVLESKEEEEMEVESGGKKKKGKKGRKSKEKKEIVRLHSLSQSLLT